MSGSWYAWIDAACDVLLDNTDAAPAHISALEEMRSALRCLTREAQVALGDAIDCAIDGGAMERSHPGEMVHPQAVRR